MIFIPSIMKVDHLDETLLSVTAER